MGEHFQAMETAASLRLMAVMALLSMVLCDLPVHCLHKDIKGEWLFQMSEANQDKNSIKCSTGNQNYQDSSSNFGLGDMNVDTPNTLKVSLLAPNIAKAVDEDGTKTQSCQRTPTALLRQLMFLNTGKHDKLARHDQQDILRLKLQYFCNQVHPHPSCLHITQLNNNLQQKK